MTTFNYSRTKFETALVDLEQRMRSLQRLSRRDDHGRLVVADAAIEELAITVEELRVVEEELRRQSEAASTALAAAEEAIRRGNDLFWHMPGAHLLSDVRGIISRGNRAGGDLFDPEAVGGKPISMYVTFEERADFGAWLRDIAGCGGAVGRRRVRWHGIDRSKLIPCEIQVARNADLALPREALMWSLRPLGEAEQA